MHGGEAGIGTVCTLVENKGRGELFHSRGILFDDSAWNSHSFQER
jgi:hypothetical protein